MRTAVFIPLLLAPALCAGGPAPATEAAQFVREGDTLWIKRAGTLTAIDLAAGTPRDATPADARPLALARSPAGPRWLARGRDGALTLRGAAGIDAALPPLAKPDGAIVGLTFDGERPLIVTATAVWRPREGAWSRLSVPASWDRLRVGRAALRVMEGTLYAGWDAGAWGGGLFALEMGSGRALGGESGNLGAASNVAALAPDPERAGCLLLGEGLIADAEWEGNFEQLCGEKVAFLHEQLMPEEYNRGRADWNTWPVWDFALRDGKVWVSREDGFFTAKIFPYFKPVAPPDPKRAGGCEWIELRPDLLAVRCDGDPRWRFAEE